MMQVVSEIEAAQSRSGRVAARVVPYQFKSRAFEPGCTRFSA